jgi:protein-S-isoprenylcysteine O-methyltransferase Ste14
VIRFIAGFDFTLLTISIGAMWLSIARPDLRTWPRPKTTPWPPTLLAIVGGAFPASLLGLLLLGVIDWDRFVLAPWARFVGVALVGVGGFWALWGYRTLGVHLSQGHPGDLIDTGAYRHCRNPQYIGAIAGAVGYALICNSALALVAAALASVAFILMPFAEEPWLREGLGATYEAYCARVPRFLPTLSGRRHQR